MIKTPLQLVSLFIATLVLATGCQTAPEVKNEVATTTVAAVPVATKTEVVPLIPDKEEEEYMLNRAAKKSAKDEKDIENEQLERHLKHSAKQFKTAHNAEGEVDALLKLAKIYRQTKRQSDAREVLERAHTRLPRLEKNNPLHSKTAIELGETYLRAEEYDKALALFEEAKPGLTLADNTLGENQVRLMERLAWTYRQQGLQRKASETAEEAAALALANYGQDSCAYRLALVEQATFALDDGDKAKFAKISSKLEKLRTKPGDRSFGKLFLRICEHNCQTREDQAQQEDFLEANSDVFAKLERQWMRAHMTTASRGAQ